MYHSIKYGSKNTWDDWHLVPVSRPVFNPPKPKTKIIDIPGGNGSIDFSDSLTGYPVYENRTGSHEFIVVNDLYSQVDDHIEWYNVYSDIMDYLHGQKMRAILEDDNAHYYEGRFSVNKWSSDKNHSKIVIDYDVGPYKWMTRGSLDDWIWDTFNFNTDSVPTSRFKNISVSDIEVNNTYEKSLFGRAPVCPVFTVMTNDGCGMYIHFVNSNLGIDIRKFVPDGTNQVPEFVITKNDIVIGYRCLSGTGLISINFKRGRL